MFKLSENQQERTKNNLHRKSLNYAKPICWQLQSQKNPIQ